MQEDLIKETKEKMEKSMENWLYTAFIFTHICRNSENRA